MGFTQVKNDRIECTEGNYYAVIAKLKDYEKIDSRPEQIRGRLYELKDYHEIGTINQIKRLLEAAYDIKFCEPKEFISAVVKHEQGRFILNLHNNKVLAFNGEDPVKEVISLCSAIAWLTERSKEHEQQRDVKEN